MYLNYGTHSLGKMGTVPARFVRRINAGFTDIYASSTFFESVWTVPIFPNLFNYYSTIEILPDDCTLVKAGSYMHSAETGGRMKFPIVTARNA
jgi:hypothetical protein